MRKFSWLSYSSLYQVAITMILALAWSSCADETPTKQALPESAAGSVAANGVSTTETYTTPVTLSQTNGGGTQTWSYWVTSTVTWSGSTTTWKYAISANPKDGEDAVKNLSHTVIAGFGNCFWGNLTTTGVTEVPEGNGTGCNVEQGIKFDNLTTTSWEVTYTFSGALKVSASAATLYVKAGNDCQPVAIPGPSCEKLGLSGKVNQLICNGTGLGSSPFAGTVTATQGNDVRTTTSDASGAYSFSNLGGVWAINVDGVFADATTTVEVGPADGVATDLYVNNRPNGSCSAISVHVDLTQCLNQSPNGPTAFAGATVTTTVAGTSVTATTDASGNASLSNVPTGTYSVTVSGVDASGNSFSSSNSVSVAEIEGNYTTSYSFDTTKNGACGANPTCSLSQGYWFAKPQSTWDNGLTLGGYSYTKAEGVAIWNTSNKGGILNVKKAFTQAAAIKLSGVDASASVWADVAIIEAYLTSLGKKLTAANIGSIKNSTGANAEAGAAAGRIGAWIDANHCAESK